MQSEFCFFHSPEKAEERQAASAAGGRGRPIRTLAADSPPIKARTPADIVNLLEILISSVLNGLIDPKVGNSVGILAGLQLKALALQVDQERLEALEASVKSSFDRV
jgi:hypothetical protein